MWYFIAIGLLALLCGVLFIFAPETLRTLNENASRVVSSFDSITFSYRISVGVALIMASVLFFLVAYYLMMHGYRGL